MDTLQLDINQGLESLDSAPEITIPENVGTCLMSKQDLSDKHGRECLDYRMQIQELSQNLKTMKSDMKYMEREKERAIKEIEEGKERIIKDKDEEMQKQIADMKRGAQELVETKMKQIMENTNTEKQKLEEELRTVKIELDQLKNRTVSDTNHDLDDQAAQDKLSQTKERYWDDQKNCFVDVSEDHLSFETEMLESARKKLEAQETELDDQRKQLLNDRKQLDEEWGRFEVVQKKQHEEKKELEERGKRFEVEQKKQDEEKKELEEREKRFEVAQKKQQEDNKEHDEKQKNLSREPLVPQLDGHIPSKVKNHDTKPILTPKPIPRPQKPNTPHFSPKAGSPGSNASIARSDNKSGASSMECKSLVKPANVMRKSLKDMSFGGNVKNKMELFQSGTDDNGNI